MADESPGLVQFCPPRWVFGTPPEILDDGTTPRGRMTLHPHPRTPHQCPTIQTTIISNRSGIHPPWNSNGRANISHFVSNSPRQDSDGFSGRWSCSSRFCQDPRGRMPKRWSSRVLHRSWRRFPRISTRANRRSRHRDGRFRHFTGPHATVLAPWTAVDRAKGRSGPDDVRRVRPEVSGGRSGPHRTRSDTRPISRSRRWRSPRGIRRPGVEQRRRIPGSSLREYLIVRPMTRSSRHWVCSHLRPDSSRTHDRAVSVLAQIVLAV
jgi:hypothetical protein